MVSTSKPEMHHTVLTELEDVFLAEFTWEILSLFLSSSSSWERLVFEWYITVYPENRYPLWFVVCIVGFSEGTPPAPLFCPKIFFNALLSYNEVPVFECGRLDLCSLTKISVLFFYYTTTCLLLNSECVFSDGVWQDS